MRPGRRFLCEVCRVNKLGLHVYSGNVSCGERLMLTQIAVEAFLRAWHWSHSSPTALDRVYVRTAK